MSAGNERVMRVLSAFDNAKSSEDYRSARRKAMRLDPISQLSCIDSLLAARKRVGP